MQLLQRLFFKLIVFSICLFSSSGQAAYQINLVKSKFVLIDIYTGSYAFMFLILFADEILF